MRFELIHGCRIVYGPIPLSEVDTLMCGFSKKALMAVDIADRIGASFVIGEPKDIEALRKIELPVSENRQNDYLDALQHGVHDVAMWLRNGERGLSSNAMCKRIFGVPADAGINTPQDPDDLRSCLLFLDAANAHDKVLMMAGVSPEWERLVAAWDQIVTTFWEEMQSGNAAPKTYALMRQALDSNDLARSTGMESRI